ncbi:RNA-directed DNA polymerase, eukaryota, reverse transcriptase zinc-binding domain protein [Tanacetum coccineum]
MAEVDLFSSLNVPLTDDIKDSWIEEMIEAYEGILEERRNDVINGHWEQNYNEAMEEVAEETSAHASFIVKNYVVNDGMAATSKQYEVKLLIKESNLLDSSRGCRIVVGWDPFILNATLLLQSDQDRVALWNNLRSHNEAIRESPWVILGDFNVTLYAGECSNGLIRDYGIQDFRRCIEVLDMEDLSINGIFSLGFRREIIQSWVVEEHWNAPVSGFAMYILAKRLMMMKPYMRELNVKNGNLFDKVKFLREELKKVQRELDKDPGDAVLREEELLYCVADKDAVIDEEKVLKQKSKIRWLKEGDHNSAYFHKIIKGRKSRSRICAVNDQCDPSYLFTKKLSNSDVVKMVENVTNEEIKVALFDIDDDKASGPDGFTSKFFKASWKIIKNDVIGVVKEFFRNRRMLGEINTTLISLIPKSKAPIKWIVECLSTASFLVSVNGESHGFFKAKRGLRQGDPISPYLFIIVMEVFSLMVDRQIQKDKGFKYHWGCKQLKITHLLFADDFLLPCHGDIKSTSVLKRALAEFTLASKGTLPVRYLGVSLVAKKLCIKDCEILIDNVKKRLDDWKNKFLTFVGRLQLIAFVLCSLQVYWATIFVLLINDEVCRPKSQGGLGLKSLYMWNKALMAKHLWNVISDKESIWVKWVQVHWIKGQNIWNYTIKDSSWCWKQLLRLRDNIRRFVGVKLGDGKKCNIWFDRWHNNGPLCKLINYNVMFYYRLKKDAKVSDFISDDGWKWPRDWNGKVISSIGNRSANNSIWSVIQRLVFGASVYFIWQERNVRLFRNTERSEDVLFKQVMDTIRLKLMSLKIIKSMNMKIATDMWNLVLCNGSGKNIGLSMNDGS